MKELTKRQKEILNFLKSFIRDHKYPPTIREIAAYFSISPKGAYDHVKALEKKQVIRCDLNRSRAIEVMGPNGDRDELVEVPILGNVAAGSPIFSEENYEGTLKIPQGTLKAGNYFALRVRGDSMRDVGILDGDLAIIKHRETADNGDIVVAMINDEGVTLKRFFREKNRVKLQAENDTYPPIYTQNTRILGKLATLIRDYA